MTGGAEHPLVLIVEDDAAIAEGLALNLRLQSYRTEVVADGEDASERIPAAEPDLILLDISLPRRSGIEVLQELRESGNNVPVVVLSARQDEFDKVAALRVGADDYITKPFALAELLARIAAVLRRASLTRASRPAPVPPPVSEDAVSSLIRFADVVVDPTARTVERAGEPVKLTHLEFELLLFFCRNAGRVYARRELVRAVWGRDAGQERTVDNFVAQLRAKLEKDPDHPAHFLTVRGSGYRFSGT